MFTVPCLQGLRLSENIINGRNTDGWLSCDSDPTSHAHKYDALITKAKTV